MMLQTMFPTIHQPSSMLGFGCMRLPTTPDGHVDEPEAIRMIRHAIDSGVTYIDTAYPYHNGESELVVGHALQDGYRQRVMLATKLPVWKVEKHEDMMQLLDEQLAKLQTDHIDFYLLHAMDQKRLEQMQRLNYRAFLDEAVAQGKIRFPAFSFHDDADTFLRILNDYDWKMCQVQMNILDDENQATLAGIRAAGQRGVGVVVMEPLRGGLLANPPEEICRMYAEFSTIRTPVAWAFRYLYTMPEVITILSGMSTWEQLEDNLDIFDLEARPMLTPQEAQLLADVKAAYIARTKTRCTACRYCQPCPMGVAIPRIFQGFDKTLMQAGGDFSKPYQSIIADQADASRCIQCGRCESACPQHLPIIQYLKEIHASCTTKETV